MLIGKGKKKKVTFNLTAPEAGRVYLAGDFNEWKGDVTPLKPQKNNGAATEWRTILQLQPGTYQYRYIVDGEWRNDPLSRERAPNEFGTFNDIVKV
ncbi:MAG: glycoside hydrolase [Desulfobacteraceae bacterium]|nr:MAG: glycoside hydrolase [Desulfobacteraceae bacterium]